MPEINSVAGQLIGMPLAGPESFSQQQLDYLKRALGVDETVLWTGDTGQILVGTTGTCDLSENAVNFDRLRLYARGSAQNIKGDTGSGLDVVEFAPVSNTAAYYPINLSYSNDGTSIHNDTCVIQISGSTLSYSKGSRFTLSSSGISINTSRGPAIVKIVGIHRISGGN